MAPRFSVVMANYNGEKYISEAIESVLAQEYVNYEFIIVDDGSTDNSREIILSYQKDNQDRIKAIYQEINQGQGAAFNAGVAAAKGDLISFIDSDDVWFPHKLRMVDNTFGDLERTAVHQHNLCITPDGKATEKPFREIMVNGDYFSFVQKAKGCCVPQFVATSGLTFPKAVLEKVLPIPMDFRTCADGYLTRTCFCFGEVVAINDFLGGYRVHSGNLTFQNPNHDNAYYLSAVLFPALNRFYEENDLKLKFSHDLNLYERAVSKLGLKAGDRVFVLRCARIEYVEWLIEKLLNTYEGITIDLATQESFQSSIIRPEVNPIIIPEGPINRLTFATDFQTQVAGKSYAVGIIPYSTNYGENYANVHNALDLLPHCLKMVGIGRNGKSYKFYRMGQVFIRAVPSDAVVWLRKLKQTISNSIVSFSKNLWLENKRKKGRGGKASDDVFPFKLIKQAAGSGFIKIGEVMSSTASCLYDCGQSLSLQKKYECPICGLHMDSWKKFHRKITDNTYRIERAGLCSRCDSLERHRQIWLYMQKAGLFQQIPRMLHFAPEPCLEAHFRSILKKNYVTSDLNQKKVDVQCDITSLDFSDNSFDLIYCSNVLEHITDDRSAMRELFRVLAPNGLAIIQVPLSEERTLEDSTIVTPEDRDKYYWQSDHVRLYGRDIRERLQLAGFSVEEIMMPDILDMNSSDIERFNIAKREIIHFCRKEK